MTLGGPTGTAARDATPRRASGERTDFFISHAGRDAAWAEWPAWQLQQARYTVELDVWDWTPGEDFVTRMQQSLQRAGRPGGRPQRHSDSVLDRSSRREPLCLRPCRRPTRLRFFLTWNECAKRWRHRGAYAGPARTPCPPERRRRIRPPRRSPARGCSLSRRSARHPLWRPRSRCDGSTAEPLPDALRRDRRRGHQARALPEPLAVCSQSRRQRRWRMSPPGFDLGRPSHRKGLAPQGWREGPRDHWRWTAKPSGRCAPASVHRPHARRERGQCSSDQCLPPLGWRLTNSSITQMSAGLLTAGRPRVGRLRPRAWLAAGRP